MKNILFIALTVFIFLSCKNQNLGEKEALDIIQKELSFPKTIDYDVFCSDPDQVRKLLSTSLEDEGWVIIQKTQKLKDIGTPLITFTDQAKPYLLSTPEKDKALGIQKVKIVEEVLDGVVYIKPDKELNLTEVEYTTVYKNFSPFAMLTSMQSKEKQTQKAHFKFSDDTWQLLKRK